MRPLRVTAFMSDGRVASSDGRFPLDSVLAYAWMAEHHPDRVWFNYAASDQSIDPDLSDALERRGEGEDWCWACSLGQYRRVQEFIEFIHKRTDQAAAERYIDFGKRRGKIDTSAGPYKNWRLPVIVQLIPSVEWYCVGDADEVRRLLRHITHIGGHRGKGYGLVREWTVEPWPEDWSVYGPEGQLMRAVPDPAGTEMCGIRPPYWSMRNQRMCRVPEVGRRGRVEAGAV